MINQSIKMIPNINKEFNQCYNTFKNNIDIFYKKIDFL